MIAARQARPFSLSLAGAIAILATSPLMAQKGKKGRGGNGDGGGSAPVQYRVTQIVNEFGGNKTFTVDMNGSGQFVGTATDGSDNEFAILYEDPTAVQLLPYNSSGGMIVLDSLFTDEERQGGTIAVADAINEWGQIAARVRIGDVTRAVRIDPPTSESAGPQLYFLNLDSIIEAQKAWSSAINNDGDVGGGMNTPEGYKVFFHSSDGQVVEEVPDPVLNFVYDMNDRDADGNVQLVSSSLFTINAITGGSSIETLPAGLTPYAVNPFGTVVGSGLKQGKGKRQVEFAFRYFSEVEDLGAGFGREINRSGDVLVEGNGDADAIYMDAHGLLSLPDLIHPDDRSVYFARELYNWAAIQIGERDATGFPVLLIVGSKSVLDGGGHTSMILTPELPEN